MNLKVTQIYWAQATHSNMCSLDMLPPPALGCEVIEAFSASVDEDASSSSGSIIGGMFGGRINVKGLRIGFAGPSFVPSPSGAVA